MSWFLSNPVKRGISLIQKKNIKEAISLFSSLVEKGDKLEDAHFYLAMCFFQLGKFNEAKSNMHIALELNSKPERVTEVLELVNWNMISSHEYFNSDQSFSPDGARVAFACAKEDTNKDGKINATDNRGIYMTEVHTGAQERLVNNEHMNSRPIFSPDGKRVAFVSRRQGGAETGLYIINLDSRIETALAEGYSVKYHLFSKEGDNIIFCGWKQGDKNSGIFSLDIKKGSITTLVPGAYENTFPSLSPDGDRLLYTSWRADTNGDGIIDFHDNSGIYLKDLTTGLETELVKSAFNNTFPSFSPDGKKVLFLSVRRDTSGDGKIDSLDNSGVYIRDIESGREKCLIEDVFYNKFPSFSPDGKKIVYVTSGCTFRLTCSKNDFFEQKGIYMLDVENKEFYQLVSEQFYGSRAPVFSPRGDRVAYISWRKGTNRGLYLADISRLPEKAVLHSWIDKNL